MADSDCSHLGATPVCDEGRGVCVQCTGDTEAARCGANSCRRSDGTCTATMRGTIDVCEACEADSECVTGRRCVRTSFMGMSTGQQCYPDAGGGCGDTVDAFRPFSVRTDATSVDGVRGAVCLLPNTTTCQALSMVGRVCSADTDCGIAALSDGVCPSAGVSAGRCSYACGADTDCRTARTCGGLPAHCR
jgi:hypothetical protein